MNGTTGTTKTLQAQHPATPNVKLILFELFRIAAALFGTLLA